MDNLAFTIEDSIGSFASLGLVVLQTDETIEEEFRSFFPLINVALYHSRIPNSSDVNKDNLKKMEKQIPHSVKLFPNIQTLNTIGYACTSGATVIGSDNVEKQVNTILPKAQVTDPLRATLRALNFLNAKKIAFISPYISDVSLAMRNEIISNGQEIVSFSSFEQSDDQVVARISPQSILSAAIKVGQLTSCDAVFISCTNLRTFTIIQKAEEKLNIPVLSSNQVLAWDMLRLAGITTNQSQWHSFGKLFQKD